MAKRVKDVAELLGVSPDTVLEGMKAGRLPGVQPVPRGHWIVTEEAFERLRQESRWTPGTAQHPFIKHRSNALPKDDEDA